MKKKIKRKNDIESTKRFIEARLKNYKANNLEEQGEIILKLIGGETLMYPKLLDEIFESFFQLCKLYNIDNKLSIIITTNGTLINKNKDIQSLLLKWKPELAFSIDGTKEIHDACRVDINGKGSYDDAVAGLRWYQTNISSDIVEVKSTFCHNTIRNYSDGIINLIKLGFEEIFAGVVGEEIWTIEKDSPIIFKEFLKVVDYLFENNLQDKVHIFQLNPKGLDMSNYISKMGQKTRNFCGSCKFIRFLGFDNKVYGCDRLCTMEKPISIGVINSNNEIEINNQEFINTIENNFREYPEECRKCMYGSQCSLCLASIYEQEELTIKEFLAQKRMCGFTHAIVAGRLYFRNRLIELKKREAELNNVE